MLDPQNPRVSQAHRCENENGGNNEYSRSAIEFMFRRRGDFVSEIGNVGTRESTDRSYATNAVLGQMNPVHLAGVDDRVRRSVG